MEYSPAPVKYCFGRRFEKCSAEFQGTLGLDCHYSRQQLTCFGQPRIGSMTVHQELEIFGVWLP
jgi:hypothetical protein